MQAARDAAQAPVPGGRRRRTCEQQTSIKCVNYLQFTVGTGEFSSGCTKVEVVLDDLCDLAKVAAGQELFKLPPETPLPITIEGLRIFPAIGCSSIQECTPRKIFSGTTVGGGGRPGRIGDYAGGVLELPVKVNEACGLPEEFFPLPEGPHLRGGVRPVAGRLRSRRGRLPVQGLGGHRRYGLETRGY